MLHQEPYSAVDFMQSFQAGEEKGFDYFFRAYHKRLCNFACRYIKDTGVAEDIVVDSFVKAWHKREKFTQEAHLKNYLYRIVYYGCLRWFESQQLHGRHNQQAARETESAEQSIVENIVHAEFIHLVYHTLEHLPPACRTIFKKLFVEGKSMKETAEELQLARSTVQTQKDRGIDILRKLLFPSGT